MLDFTTGRLMAPPPLDPRFIWHFQEQEAEIIPEHNNPEIIPDHNALEISPDHDYNHHDAEIIPSRNDPEISPLEICPNDPEISPDHEHHHVVVEIIPGHNDETTPDHNPDHIDSPDHNQDHNNSPDHNERVQRAVQIQVNVHVHEVHENRREENCQLTRLVQCLFTGLAALYLLLPGLHH